MSCARNRTLLTLLFVGSLTTGIEGDDDSGEVEIVATLNTEGSVSMAAGEVEVTGIVDASDQILVTIIAEAAGDVSIGDFTGDGKVNLSDFFLFADAFGGTDARFDLTGDGKVNLSDFFIFADVFGGDRGKLLVLAESRFGIPLTGQLSQNFPNPFNSETVIDYRLPRGGEVSLVVYNLAGQKVRTLVHGTRTPGNHSVIWDGRDDARSSVSSSVYFYQLRTNNGLKTMKLLLVR